jgi:YVTN family beta-propeller protein
LNQSRRSRSAICPTVWPSGDGARVYVGIENGDAVIAIDTATNQVIATIPNGQAAQALVYVPQAVPTATAGVENLMPLGLASKAVHLALAAPDMKRTTTVSLFDQGLTQVLQAAVAGLEPARPYMLALTSKPDGTGIIEPIAQFMTNPAGAQVVNAVGPIRQIVDPEAQSRDERRYLTVMTVDNGKPGRPVQMQQLEITR